MELVDVRRLTGPNLLLDGPAAVLEARDHDPQQLLLALRARLGNHLEALQERDPTWRTVTGQGVARTWHDASGLSWALPMPVDRLYAGCALLEAVWDDVLCGVATGSPVADRHTTRVVEEADDERDPTLLRLLDAAAAHGVTGLWDDDEVSVGIGRGSRTWRRDEVPHPDEVSWDEVQDVPVALVTGTNGKSTTVRMLAEILRSAGRTPGHSSTDGIVVDGQLVESGDWSGPGGGRAVARDRRVGACVLETARGGMLRRGLPLERAEVAVVTNVAADHLGEYGIETVDGLARAKLVVGRAVGQHGVLVTNAEDHRLVRHAPHGERTWWFALDPGAQQLATAVADGATTATVVDGHVVLRDGDGDRPVVAVADLPASFGGAARHNVANALAATLAATALGVAPDTIGAGLRAFTPDAATNPGRANRYELDGVTVLVDFAHNQHAVRAMTELATSLSDGRTLVLFSQAGDRDDAALDDLAAAVHASDPDRCVVADVPRYLRGRDPMEVPGRLAAALVARGVAPDDVVEAPDAVEGARSALDWAQPGDVLLLLVLQHRNEVASLLADRGATAGGRQ